MLVQVKNGAIDFMPREPFHPLFGALNKTPIIAEIQATQEYLGQAKHLVYLGTMWEEFLDVRHLREGQGINRRQGLEGAVIPQRVTGIVSVLNPGLDRNWCGHHFSQSNWYASGRLAWNPELAAQQIADEWTRMTFSNEPKTVATIRTHDDGLARGVRELHDAARPASSDRRQSLRARCRQNAKAQRADWTATYYHQASAEGIGFDRTMTGQQGRRAVLPAGPRHVRQPGDVPGDVPAVVPPLRVGLQAEVREDAVGRALREVSGGRPSGGRDADDVAVARRARSMPQRHKEVADRLAIQVADAAKWSDEILKYFQTFSKLPIPTVKPLPSARRNSVRRTR